MLVVNEWGEQGEEGEFCQRKDTFIKNWARCVAKFPEDTVLSLRLNKKRSLVYGTLLYSGEMSKMVLFQGSRWNGIGRQENSMRSCSVTWGTNTQTLTLRSNERPGAFSPQCELYIQTR